MSTRAAIARYNEDGTIEAVYSHWDGYPTGVGQQLVDWVAGQPMERREFVVNKLLSEKIGWSVLCNADIDMEPDWFDYSAKNYPNLSWEDAYDAYKKDPRAQAPQSYTARGETDEWEHQFENVQALAGWASTEYLYIFSHDLQTMEVWSNSWSTEYSGKLITVVDLNEHTVLQDNYEDAENEL